MRNLFFSFIFILISMSSELYSKVLFDFNSGNDSGPFTVKNQMGVFEAHKYINFDVSKLSLEEWKHFDHLEMDVYNPNENWSDFFISLADTSSKDYWSQLNLKQTLRKGWNHLIFNLNESVGERGSHRDVRLIKYEKLKKLFIAVDPENLAHFINNNFLIDNITLSSYPVPTVPKEVIALDFGMKKYDNGLKLITPDSKYSGSSAIGFENTQFGKSEDSEYAPSALRETIGVLNGHFKINLPKGNYHISLIIDKLGYWDIPFWRDRTIFINGKPIFKESRPRGEDFLADVLKFQNVTPHLNDSPYDLYLKKIFRPLENANQFVQLPSQINVSMIEPSLTLSPFRLSQSNNSKKLFFLGGHNEQTFQVMQIFSPEKEIVSLEVSELKKNDGQLIYPSLLQFNEVMNQFTSPGNNHETYLITGKFLKPLKSMSVLIDKNEVKHLWIKLKIPETSLPGKYEGFITLHFKRKSERLPIEICVENYHLPEIHFPVGFFGIDPLPYTYYRGSGYEEIRKKFRMLALKKISDGGFTTFSGLPEVPLKIKGSDFSLDTKDLDSLLSESKALGVRGPLFSYGGQFPQTLLNTEVRPKGMTEDVYLKKLAILLKPYFDSQKYPVLVHTFSDEAGGYSNKIASDIELGLKLKKYFPFMQLGGFSSINTTNELDKLNQLFDYGFYSNINRATLDLMQSSKKKWGFYNGAPGNLDDPRFTFSLGLFIARKAGLNQYLEWHSSAVQNYPYYDFDGRESDVVNFFPTIGGELLTSIKFEMAVDGLNCFRKIALIEAKLEKANTRNWIEKIFKENDYHATDNFIAALTKNNKNNYPQFIQSINDQLISLYNE
jgi:hypothetical protein